MERLAQRNKMGFFYWLFPKFFQQSGYRFLLSGVSLACGKPEFTELAVHKSA
jgi:hypothetical protein